MDIRSFFEQNAIVFALLGLLLAFAGWFWLLIQAFRTRPAWGVAVLLLPPLAVAFGLRHWQKGRRPLSLLLIGSAIAVLPPIYVNLIPIDLGPYERIVDGERHLTLTGWDRNDYAVLGSKRDTAVLQMANADVSDATLTHLRGMTALRELDLNNTGISDAGLDAIKDLPALTSLRLAHTKITDAGFRSALLAKESLVRLDLQGTAVSKETAQAWKTAKAGRRVLQ